MNGEEESAEARFLRLSVLDTKSIEQRKQQAQSLYYGQFTYTPSINQVGGVGGSICACLLCFCLF